MNPILIYSSMLGGLLAGGCAGTQQARTFNMNDGSAATLTIAGPGASAGSVTGKLASGASCHGSFSASDARSAKPLASSEMRFTESARTSVAELSCDTGAVLRCAFAGRTGESFSYGECRDQAGAAYALVF